MLLLLALLVVLVWGLNFVFIKWGVEEVPPLLLGETSAITVLLRPKPTQRLTGAGLEPRLTSLTLLLVLL